jgi:ATP synthase protein I
VKIVVSVVMLALAARIVPGLNWPVMLATLVVCMQTYAFALLWRGRGSR